MEKILIVDDILPNRTVIKKALLSFDEYTVIEAENGQKGLDLFEKESPDLIIMDINMPEMNGYEATSAIKSKTGDDYLPIIFVTALTEESSLSNALASGGDDFINKPIDIEILRSKVRAHLRIRKLNQEILEKNNSLNKLNQHLTREQELIEYFFNNALQKSYLDNSVINYHMSSMSTFNGDVLLVERSPQGGMYLLTGDFTGHGLSAAMGTLPAALIFFKMVNECATVNEMARELNHQLNTFMPPGMFFAASIIELNAKCDMINIWAGGMPDSYWTGSNGELKGKIHSKNMPLGILPDTEFIPDVDTLFIEEGDRIYFYTDGVIEASNSEGVAFGEERLENILVSGEGDRINQVLSEMALFTGKNSQQQDDDITLIEMTCQKISAAKVHDDQDTTVQILPGDFTFKLNAEQIRNHDPVIEIVDILGSINGFERHKGILQTILSEMYSNALDHSILGLTSIHKISEDDFYNYYLDREEKILSLEKDFITLNFKINTEQNDQKLKITMQDSGKGFDGNYQTHNENKLYGRGLSIINSLCEKIKFSDNGTTLEAWYQM